MLEHIEVLLNEVLGGIYFTITIPTIEKAVNIIIFGPPMSHLNLTSFVKGSVQIPSS